VSSRRVKREGDKAAEADNRKVKFKQQNIAQQRLGLQEIERQGREVCEVEGLVGLIERWLGGC
jgi:hypothetical protein